MPQYPTSPVSRVCLPFTLESPRGRDCTCAAHGNDLVPSTGLGTRSASWMQGLASASPRAFVPSPFSQPLLRPLLHLYSVLPFYGGIRVAFLSLRFAQATALQIKPGSSAWYQNWPSPCAATAQMGLRPLPSLCLQCVLSSQLGNLAKCSPPSKTQTSPPWMPLPSRPLPSLCQGLFFPHQDPPQPVSSSFLNLCFPSDLTQMFDKQVSE